MSRSFFLLLFVSLNLLSIENAGDLCATVRDRMTNFTNASCVNEARAFIGSQSKRVAGSYIKHDVADVHYKA